MGCTVSSDRRHAIARSRQIDKELRSDMLRKQREVKLLLLGEWWSFQMSIRIAHPSRFSLQAPVNRASRPSSSK